MAKKKDRRSPITKKIIKALPRNPSSADCERVAKRLKVKLQKVLDVRRNNAEACGYKITRRKPSVTLDLGALTELTPKPKRKPVRTSHTGMRGAAVKALKDHGNQLPEAEQSFYRAALELVLSKGD